jgi:hypothetical protein
MIVRVIRRGAWHVDLEVADAWGSHLKIASKLRGEGFNVRVLDEIVLVEAGPTSAPRSVTDTAPG